MRHRGGVIGLGEDRARQCGDGLVGATAHGRQVADEMHPTSLPAGLGEDLGNGALETLVAVGDDELDALVAALSNRCQGVNVL